MLLSENFMISIRALRANKMRSALTMLGIIIGVAAVVALLSIGNGASASITSDVESMGSNVIAIRPGQMAATFANQASSTSNSYLYLSDYERLASSLRGVAGISPEYQDALTVKYGSSSYSVPVSGVGENYFSIRSYELAHGRLLTERDRNLEARVAVIGANTAEDLFGNLNPVGKTIKIKGVSFEVVGVLASKGSAGLQDPDSGVFIPLETGYAKLFGSSATVNGQQAVKVILISSESSDAVDAMMAQSEYLLRREHRLDPTEESDFNIASQNDALETLNTITQTLTIFLGVIATISLLVGGIGIMNIMLVSVTERTKEIGLRKAVGARKGQILTQFLIETMVISLLGGLIGIALGVGISLGMTALNLIIADISISTILMAFFFAVIVGAFFGIYPAYRAASLHPIEALRYE